MSETSYLRADSPTLEPEELYPDSPTLASPKSFSSKSSRSSSKSIYSLLAPRPRNPRRGASVLEGILWSNEGTRLIPNVEDLHCVYEAGYDKDSLRRLGRYTDTATAAATNDWKGLKDLKNVCLSTQKASFSEREFEDKASPNLFGLTNQDEVKDPNDPEDEWVFDGTHSRATSRTVSRRNSIESTVPLLKMEPKTPSSTFLRKSVPKSIQLPERKFSSLSTFSLASSSKLSPSLDSPLTPITPPDDIPLDAPLRIRHAVSKGRERAFENLVRGHASETPISLSKWQEIDSRTAGEELHHTIAEAWAKLSADVGTISKRHSRNLSKIDWHQKRNKFAPLRYSVIFPRNAPIRDPLQMQAELEERDPEGRLRKHRSRVNSLRISKIKEIFRPSILEQQQIEANKTGIALPYDAEIDFEGPFSQLNGKTPNPTPSTAEMLHVLTPLDDGQHKPPGQPPSCTNPFASLYRGYRTIAHFENDSMHNDPGNTITPFNNGKRISSRKSDPVAPRLSLEDIDKPRVSRHLALRFEAHTSMQDHLREVWAERENGTTAMEVARNTLDIILKSRCEATEGKLEAPLRDEKRDEEGNVVCDLEHYHYVVAYLTKWIERCERESW
jgi:hypothetical protein